MAATPLSGRRVVDLSSGIAGGYCSKVLVDAGAEVVKLEPPDGDPLRRWAIGRRLAVDEDGALFRFLACGTRSVVVDPGDVTRAEELVAGADAVVWSPGTALAEHASLDPARLRVLASQAAVVAITPFGLDGPWAGRAWTELTLQAWAGGMWHRGTVDRPPVHAGGRIGEWGAGAVAAVALLAALRRSSRTGVGELVDVSMLESIALTHSSMYPVTFMSVIHRPFIPYRRVNIPSVEPTKDGYVGFMVVTGQQWLDFCVAIGRPEWMEDPELGILQTRIERADELRGGIHAYMTAHTTEEVIAQASLFRVPVAPIADGSTVTTLDHFVERRAYTTNPTGGFLQPTPAYRLPAGSVLSDPAPSPRLGEHTGTVGASPAGGRPHARDRSARLPLEGVRVADFTMFWAGPIVGSVLAMLGAEVIHVESASRPDGMRLTSARQPGEEQWWEWGPLFLAGNTNKLGVTLDLETERGRELALELIAKCDVVLDNFSPRVMDHFGLGYDQLRTVRPDVIMVRMSAYGLDGPWRDHTGYAQTIEQVAGMAFITGWPDRPPITPNGPCDPLSGYHGVMATLLALEHRDQTGEGMLVDIPMVGGALNMAAEVAIEYSAYGNLLTRMGNRDPVAAPQNVYRTADVDDEDVTHDCYVAIAVATDDQWHALVAALGNPDWATDPALATVEGRRAAHDVIDNHLAAWCVERSTDDIVAILWPPGVPVGAVVAPHRQDQVEQLVARSYFEDLDHPVVGTARYQTFPAHFSAGPHRFHRAPSPTLGGDNDKVFGGLLGLTPDQLTDLRATGVIGEIPKQARAIDQSGLRKA